MKYLPPEYLNSPLNVKFEVTNNCNCKCLHCFNDSGVDVKAELSTKQIFHVLNQLAEENVFAIHFTGGEPFIRRDIYELLGHAIDLGFSVSFTSNGSLINMSSAKFFSKNDIEAEISLDSIIPFEHDTFRGRPGLCKKVLKSIKLLNENGTKISIATTVSKINANSIERLIDYLVKCNIPTITISECLPVGRGAMNSNALLLSFEEKRKLIRTLERKITEYTGIIEIDYTLSFDFIIDAKRPERGCNAGISTCAISSEGLVKPCPFFPADENDSLLNKKFNEIWHGSKLLSKFRNGWIIEECVHCKYWLTKCIGGCRAVPFIEGRGFYGAYRSCPILSM